MRESVTCTLSDGLNGCPAGLLFAWCTEHWTWERRQLRWTGLSRCVALEKPCNCSGLCFPHLPSGETCLTALTGPLKGCNEKAHMVAPCCCCQILSRRILSGPPLNTEATTGLAGLVWQTYGRRRTAASGAGPVHLCQGAQVSLAACFLLLLAPVPNQASGNFSVCHCSEILSAQLLARKTDPEPPSPSRGTHPQVPALADALGGSSQMPTACAISRMFLFYGQPCLRPSDNN